MAHGRGAQKPYQNLWGTGAPTTNVNPGGNFILATSFYADVAGQIMGVKFYRDRLDGANHLAWLTKRGSAGNRDLRRAVAFLHNPATVGLVGWNTKYLGSPIAIPASEWWDVTIWWTGQTYYATPGALVGGDVVSGNLHTPADGTVDPFGVTTPNSRTATTLNANPNGSLAGAMAGIDIVFLPD